MEGQGYAYSWTRDMPIEVANTITSIFRETYHIIQVTRPGGYAIEGVERFEQKIGNMELFGLLAMSEKRVLIDSCLQHASAALGLPSTVLWIGTSPTVFGYSIHTNVQAQIPKTANQLINSYLFDYQFENNTHECPYMDVSGMFNLENLISLI